VPADDPRRALREELAAAVLAGNEARAEVLQIKLRAQMELFEPRPKLRLVKGDRS
jgi:hypothetical protein